MNINVWLFIYSFQNINSKKNSNTKVVSSRLYYIKFKLDPIVWHFCFSLFLFYNYATIIICALYLYLKNPKECHHPSLKPCFLRDWLKWKEQFSELQETSSVKNGPTKTRCLYMIPYGFQSISFSFYSHPFTIVFKPLSSSTNLLINDFSTGISPYL